MAPRHSDILVQALPPATDYVTYLTIIECNLTVEDIPLLLELLQDVTLTLNIGWDLVILLLPFLPASESCLQTIARLGNPREVVLKVTEALRLLDFDETSGLSSPNGERDDASATKKDALQDARFTSTSSVEALDKMPPAVLHFATLASMLSVLHPRIKTKSPSRFLSTSLQAVLIAFSRAQTHVEMLFRSVYDFLSSISNPDKEALTPAVPPRPGPPSASTSTGGPGVQHSAGALQEVAIQKKLMQTFVTHMTEVYLLNLASIDDIPGLGWSRQAFEAFHQDKVVPGKININTQMAVNKNFRERHSLVDDFLTLGENLGLTSSAMLEGALLSPTESLDSQNLEDEEEPPSTAEEIPLSNIGCLFLLAADQIRTIMDGDTTAARVIPIFPDQAQIIKAFIGSEDDIKPEILRHGSESVLDAILSLSLIALEANEIGEPNEDEYEQFLKIMSFISATTASSTLRYYAHFITSTVLRSNPSDAARLHFIGHVLKFTEYDNLKVSAVSWIKGETLEAMPMPGQVIGQSSSVFATPGALRSLAHELFPDLRNSMHSANTLEFEAYLETQLSFFLSGLNFYYMLISAPPLRDALDVTSLHREEDIDGRFLKPLRQAVLRQRDGLRNTGSEEDENKGEHGHHHAHVEWMLLEATLDRIDHVLPEMR